VLRDVYQNGQFNRFRVPGRRSGEAHLLSGPFGIESKFCWNVADRVPDGSTSEFTYRVRPGKPNPSISNSGSKMGALDLRGLIESDQLCQLQSI